MHIDQTLAQQIAAEISGSGPFTNSTLSIYAGTAPSNGLNTFSGAPILTYSGITLSSGLVSSAIRLTANATVTDPKFAFASASGTAGFAILHLATGGRILLTVGDSSSTAEVKLSQTNIISGERYALIGLQIDIPYL